MSWYFPLLCPSMLSRHFAAFIFSPKSLLKTVFDSFVYKSW